MSSRVHVPASTEVVLSCPACWSWQLHYTATELVPEVFASLEVLDAVIETILREHVARDCTHPLFFARLAKSRGVI